MTHNTIIGEYDKDKVSIRFSGKNNSVTFGRNFKSGRLALNFEGDDGVFSIGNNSSFAGSVRIGSSCRLIIGDRLMSLFPNSYFIGEATAITVGDDCLFSGGITFRTDDSHAIYDVVTSERINKSMDIIIGNHVWICEECRILKNTLIRDGSVIGMRTLLSNCVIANNAIVGGNPFRYLRKNIAWEKPYLGGEIFKRGLSKSPYWNLTKEDDL